MKSEAELKELHGEAYVAKFVSEQSPFRLERLIQYFNIHETSHVVDFACGNGLLMRLVAPRVSTYTGVDFSSHFIEAAEQVKAALSVSNAEFHCADIVEFCSAHPSKFDTAFAMDVSEHVYDDEWRRLLQAIKGSLKPHGRLYLHTPNADFFLERMKRKNFIVRQLPEHIAVRNLEQNIALLGAAGFELATTRLLPHYNVLRFLHPFSYLPLVGRYLKARILIEAIAR